MISKAEQAEAYAATLSPGEVARTSRAHRPSKDHNTERSKVRCWIAIARSGEWIYGVRKLAP